jgi:hypothetical protein
MKTAVEWLVKIYLQTNKIDNFDIEQAKEMEKEQIENAYWDGGQDVPMSGKQCEQYYNETFKKK